LSLTGDGSPAAKVFIDVEDPDCLHRELTNQQNSRMRAGIEAAE
jgi:hypothetical protein